MDTQFAGRWCALSILHTPPTFSRKHLGMARYGLKMLELMRWPQPPRLFAPHRHSRTHAESSCSGPAPSKVDIVGVGCSAKPTVGAFVNFFLSTPNLGISEFLLCNCWKTFWTMLQPIGACRKKQGTHRSLQMAIIVSRIWNHPVWWVKLLRSVPRRWNTQGDGALWSILGSKTKRQKILTPFGPISCKLWILPVKLDASTSCCLMIQSWLEKGWTLQGKLRGPQQAKPKVA